MVHKKEGWRSDFRKTAVALGERKPVFLFAIFFLCGVLSGALLLRSMEPQLRRNLETIISNHLANKETDAVVFHVISSFTANLTVLAVLFFCGFCAIAQPLLYAIVIFRGMSYGMILGCLYLEYGMKAVGFIAIRLLPSTVLCTIILIIACSLARIMAGSISVKVRGGQPMQTMRASGYSLRFILLSLFLLAVCWADALLAALTGGLWPIL